MLPNKALKTDSFPLRFFAFASLMLGMCCGEWGQVCYWLNY